MDAYDRCTNLGGKNLANSIAIYGQGRALFRPPTYTQDCCYTYVQIACVSIPVIDYCMVETLCFR